MIGLKKQSCLYLLGMIFTLCGCSALSHPGAGQRLSNLQRMPADQDAQAKRIHLGNQYIDGLTPLQRLEKLYDQIESQLASAPGSNARLQQPQAR